MGDFEDKLVRTELTLPLYCTNEFDVDRNGDSYIVSIIYVGEEDEPSYCAVDLVVGDNYKASELRGRIYRCNKCKSLANEKRMWVNGIYIPNSHPLYRPGRYKSFNDAAFSSLQNYNSTKTGYVYVIRRKSEGKAHKAVEAISESRNSEWFKVSVEDAVECISDILKQQNSPQLIGGILTGIAS